MTIPHPLAGLASLNHHRDPFDRLSIAQAGHEGSRLVGRGSYVARHGVPQIVA